MKCEQRKAPPQTALNSCGRQNQNPDTREKSGARAFDAEDALHG